METNIEKPSLVQTGIKYGLILGFVNIGLNLILYFFNKEYMISFTYMFVILLVGIVITVLCVREWKRENGNIISFANAFLLCMLCVAIGNLLYTIYDYILYNFIDKELAGYLKEKVLDKTVGMMEKWGAPQESIDQTIEKMEREDFSRSGLSSLTNYLKGMLFQLIPALIIAAIMKKKAPEEAI